MSRRVNRELKVGGIILCLYDAGTRHGSEVIEDLEGFFAARRNNAVPWAEAKLFRTRIRRNIRLAECPSFGQSIFQYAPNSRGAEDYASLAAEIQGHAARRHLGRRRDYYGQAASQRGRHPGTRRRLGSLNPKVRNNARQEGARIQSAEMIVNLRNPFPS